MASDFVSDDRMPREVEGPVRVRRQDMFLHLRGKPRELLVDLRCAPLGRRGVHHLGEVQGDHRHAGGERAVDVLDRLQVVPVRAVALLESLLEHKEGRVPHDTGIVASREGELAHGLLGKDGGGIVAGDRAQVSRGGKAQPVAASDRRGARAQGDGRGEGKEPVQDLGVPR